MGDKQTFINAFDRLVSEMVEDLTGNSFTQPDETSTHDSTNGAWSVYRAWVDQAQSLEVVEYLDAGDSPTKESGTALYWNGKTVYFRTASGRTRTCRAGEWVHILFEVNTDRLICERRDALDDAMAMSLIQSESLSLIA